MSRKTNRPKLVSRPEEASSARVLGAAGEYWPSELAPFSRTLCLGAGYLLFAVVLYGVITFAGLEWAKRLMAWGLGFGNPFDIVAGSMDLAGVLLVLGAVVAGAAVHPVVGLTVLFLVRPWLDGYTYPTDNLYFLWAVLGLVACWGLRLLQGRGTVRHGRALAAFGALLVIALLTSFSTIQYDNTFRQLLYLVLYAAVLLLATNAANTPATRGILLTGLLASMAIQSVYAVLHFEYLLPFMRKMVQDPRLLLHYFGVETLTPELARRFEINRAFGSLLFPNALAAFLILGLPYTLFGSLAAWESVRPAWRARVPVAASDLRNQRNALALGAAMWFVAFLGFLGALTFVAGYQPAESQLGALGLFVVSALAAAVPAGGIWWCTQRYGVVLCGLLARAVALPVLAALFSYALWITYSRGGLLALFAALGLTAALLWLGPQHWARLAALRPSRRAATAALCAVLALTGAGLFALPEFAVAQDAAPAQRIETVTEQGQAVGVGELANPESFLLRLTYWRVGLSMFADNPLLGVGLGNFKVAYPHYQYLGAGHVKEAHNGYLQLFCETGLLGGLCLLALFGGLVVWGGRLILRTQDRQRRLVIAGLYAGIVALMLHAALDIDFSHPTLVMFLMAFAGVLLGTVAQHAEDAGEARTESPSRALPAMGLGVMLFCALLLGLSTRVYSQDLSLSRIALINVASRQEMMQRLQLGTAILQEIPKTLWDQNRPLHRFPIAELLKLIPDLAVLRTLGDVYAPDTSGAEKYRLLGRSEAVPPESFLVLLKPGALLRALLETEKGWLADVARADARFPHSVELAMYMSRWSNMLVGVASIDNYAEHLGRYQERTAYWAAACAERSPMLADAHLASADGWWALARTQEGDAQRASFERALAAYARAADLNALQGDYNVFYSTALNTMADAEAAAGNAEGAARYRTQAAEQLRLGEERQKARWKRGL